MKTKNDVFLILMDKDWKGDSHDRLEGT